MSSSTDSSLTEAPGRIDRSSATPSAAIISFQAERAARGIEPLTAIRIGDRVRRGFSWVTGTVLGFRGRGSAAEPLEALVQWPRYNEFVCVAFLKHAPRNEIWPPVTPGGAA
jgi:hypothetical protein